MMWHVLFIGIFRNIQFPLTTVKGKQCMLYNGLADDIFVLRNIRTVKRWLQFGRTEGSITKENIAYALMGTDEHLRGICDLRDYNFDSRNTKYSFRPTHVWHEMVIGRNVTYIVVSFPLTIIRV